MDTCSSHGGPIWSNHTILGRKTCDMRSANHISTPPQSNAATYQAFWLLISYSLPYLSWNAPFFFLYFFHLNLQSSPPPWLTKLSLHVRGTCAKVTEIGHIWQKFPIILELFKIESISNWNIQTKVKKINKLQDQKWPFIIKKECC